MEEKGDKKQPKKQMINCRYRGVRQVSREKWVAEIGIPNYTKLKQRIGTYSTSIEAAHAYDNAAKSVYGNNAVLNFPHSQPCRFQENIERFRFSSADIFLVDESDEMAMVNKEKEKQDLGSYDYDSNCCARIDDCRSSTSGEADKKRKREHNDDDDEIELDFQHNRRPHDVQLQNPQYGISGRLDHTGGEHNINEDYNVDSLLGTDFNWDILAEDLEKLLL